MTNTTEYDFTEIDVCLDCLVFIASGELPEDPDRAIEVAAQVRIPDGASVETASDGESFFSRYPCECCGSSLGGDRQTAVIVEQLPAYVFERTS